MTYHSIIEGIFINRPNRFIAYVELEDRTVVCHVKNTGRCRELLVPGTRVILEYHPHAAALGRKTEYDLIGVYKGNLLINMDSQAPNQAAREWLEDMSAQKRPVLPIHHAPGGQAAGWPDSIRREVTHGDSRFDLAFTLETFKDGGPRSALMEVKGVTLEEHGQAMFPDAPTERGVKHLHGLIRARKEGFEAYVLFLIQMKGIHSFRPNDATHPEFGRVLRLAADSGVHILVMDCVVTPNSMEADQPVQIIL